MKLKSVLSKVALSLFMVITVNQMACNNASFEASPENGLGQAPAADNVDSPFNQTDSGDIVRCDNVGDFFCDTGDDGVTDDLPPITWTIPPYTVTPNGYCRDLNYRDTRKNDINGVNVWMVVDSSRSFDDERVAVARALQNGFLNRLRRSVPVNVSVIAAHAPSESYRGKQSFAPSVRSNAFYYNGRPGSGLTNALSASMQESPISLAKQDGASIRAAGRILNWSLRGPHSGSDELGLRNFMDAMSTAYIPRDNAWVVLFMSDENDVCTPIPGRAPSHPNDEPEMQRLFCSGVTPRNAFSKAVQFAGDRPFAMGALVYTEQAPIPSGAHPQASIGYGYTSVVSRAGAQGAMIDLADARSFSGLQGVADRLVNEMANITNEAAGYHNVFPIYDRNNQRISLSKVKVVNGKYDLQVYVDGVKTNYRADTGNSVIIPSRKGERVRLRYCLK